MVVEARAANMPLRRRIRPKLDEELSKKRAEITVTCKLHVTLPPDPWRLLPGHFT